MFSGHYLPGSTGLPLEYVSRKLHQLSSKLMIFKLLANNDNYKQQIYFGGDLDALWIIPHGDLVDEPTKSKDLMLKARRKLSRIDIYHDVPLALAPASKTGAATEPPNYRCP